MLVFLHVGTRRAFISPATTNPTEAWVRSQTESYLQHAHADKLPVKMLFHDRDGKFTAAAEADLMKHRIEVRKTAFRAPNTNAYVERFIQTIQQEYSTTLSSWANSTKPRRASYWRRFGDRRHGCRRRHRTS